MLNDKEKLFVQTYIEDYNMARAYRAAFGTNNNCPKADSDCGRSLLRNKEIKAYLHELQQERIEQWGDIANLLMQNLVDDVNFRDEDGRHSSSWQKSVDLLQKQLGLQTKNVNMAAPDKIKIVIRDEEETKDEK